LLRTKTLSMGNWLPSSESIARARGSTEAAIP
jgi:hypothetical protein